MQARHSPTRQAFATARQQGRRHRDIAQALALSEGELIAAHLGPVAEQESPLQAQRLRAEWPEIITALESLGDVMALTRNESCVHEKIGTYRASSHQRGIGLVLGGAIDLRLFYAAWAHGYAVCERLADGALQRSLQFFDAAGVAIHKVFLRPQSQLAAYEQLLVQFRAEDQTPGLILAEGPAEPQEQADALIDVAGLRSAWASLRDTHEFFGLLKRFGVSRSQALRLAAPGYAQALPAGSAHELISRAAQDGVSIMVFVGNPGMIQIHSGPVQKVVVMGPWLNIMDAAFNLHLREDQIASAWLVRKPTVDGLVSSLELFDAQGRTIAMLFGERKPGQAERCDWRSLLDSLAETPREVATCA
ncbi:putative hemin transport protein [Paucibacter oligotrophus]|uniref:Putative hemin transport protein n=1 Tax=Roseateles oligotrophus TaxID=1769250 RepID=A0A840LDB4_9BURK|nr:ChuX/HutX family heme-like substrate-binding protein [Roseateles oligotrophus]MBB4844188.1 putative hemin transport protein [Roseateles oligotrophus]